MQNSGSPQPGEYDAFSGYNHGYNCMVNIFFLKKSIGITLKGLFAKPNKLYI